MDAEIDSIIKQMEKLAPPRDVHLSNPDVVHTYQSLYMSRLFVLLAKDAEKQAEGLDKRIADLIGIAEAQRILAAKLDRQTDTLIRLTRWLRALTVWLVVLTAALCIFETFHFLESRSASALVAPHTAGQPAKGAE